MASALLRSLLMDTYPMRAESTPDLSGFTIVNPGEQESGVAFDIEITDATDVAGDPLSGAIEVTVVSDEDGEVYNDTPTFTAGAATLSSITLTTVALQTLTITVAGVTNPEQVQVDVVAADLSGFTIVNPGAQEPEVAFNLELEDATDTAGDPLSGAIAVTVDSNFDGEVYSDSPTFTDGDATLADITLTTQGNHVLTVTVTGVTNPEDIGVQVGGAATASEFLLSLNPDGYWKLGEASGDALDYSGNGNDGTVTLGSGTRATTALDFDGDGSITLATNTTISIAANAAINNLFDGGGCVLFLCQVSSLSGSPWRKSADASVGWQTSFNASLGLIFQVLFSGNDGLWFTGSGSLTTGEVNVIAITYDSDSTDNDPTVILWNPTNGLQVRTVGDGLTQSGSATGTRESDAGAPLNINVNGTAVAGIFDEMAIWSSSPPSQQDIEDYIALVQSP